MSALTDAIRSSCGRCPKKPFGVGQDEKIDEYDETDADIEILELRAYLAKKAIESQKLENQEAKQGHKEMMTKLTKELDHLILEKVDMMNALHQRAMKSIRSRRDFQLATGSKSADAILAWLEDLAFDLKKEMDRIQEESQTELKRLEDLWVRIRYYEKYPYPGAEPSEKEYLDHLYKLGLSIVNKYALRDVSKHINMQYHEIYNKLNFYKRAWPGQLQVIEKRYAETIKDGKSLEKMLHNSYRFRDVAFIRHKKLRAQLIVNRALRKAHTKSISKTLKNINARGSRRWKRALKRANELSETLVEDGPMAIVSPERDRQEEEDDEKRLDSCYETLAYLQAQCKEYERLAQELVQKLEVSDLNEVPRQLVAVMQYRDVLKAERRLLAEKKYVLVNNEYNVILVHRELTYTGQSSIEQQEDEVADRLQKIKDIEEAAAPTQRKTNKLASTEMDVLLSSIGGRDAFNLGQSKSYRPLQVAAIDFMEDIVEKLTGVVKDLEELEDLVKDEVPMDELLEKYNDVVILPPTLKYCRLAKNSENMAMGRDDDSDPDFVENDDLEGKHLDSIFDDKVLEREDIKATSRHIQETGRSRLYGDQD